MPLVLRLLMVGDVLEVFLADEPLSIVTEGQLGGSLVLLSDDARVRFADLSVRPIEGVSGR